MAHLDPVGRLLFFVDGRAIRVASIGGPPVPNSSDGSGDSIGQSSLVRTLVGDPSALPSHARLPPCGHSMLGTLVYLRGPSTLRYSPVDGNIYFVDNRDAVFRLDPQTTMVTLVAGNPRNCVEVGAPTDQERQRPLATRHPFKDIRDVAIGPAGQLYIAERARIWRLDADGYLYSVSGLNDSDHLRLHSVSAIAVSMFGHVIIADNGRSQIMSLHYELPKKKDGQFQVLSPDTREMYTFNVDGQHMSTESSVTGGRLYSLHFQHNSINGWLSRIVSPSGNLQFDVHRDTQSRPTRLQTPAGISYNVSLDSSKRISRLATSSTSWQFQYNEADLLTSVLQSGEQVPLRFEYYAESGRLRRVTRPSGLETELDDQPAALDPSTAALLFAGGDRYRRMVTRLRTADFAGAFCLTAAAGFPTESCRAASAGATSVVGPALQITTGLGFEPETMSLIHGNFTIKRQGYSVSYQHSRTKNNLKFTKRIVSGERVHTSSWLYHIARLPRVDQTRLGRFRRATNRRQWVQLRRDYEVSRSEGPYPLPFRAGDASVGGRRDATPATLKPRTLLVNGRRLLEVQFDGNTRLESYSVLRADAGGLWRPWLRLQYNTDYQVTGVSLLASSGLDNSVPINYDIHFEYSRFGEVQGIKWNQRPLLRIEYDLHNRPIKMYNAFTNDDLEYQYADNVGHKIVKVSRAGQSGYQLQYSPEGTLTGATSPNGLQLSIHRLVGLGLERLVYQPFGFKAGQTFLLDLDPASQLPVRLAYPSRLHQVRCRYRPDHSLAELEAGSERVWCDPGGLHWQRLDVSTGTNVSQTGAHLSPGRGGLLVDWLATEVRLPVPAAAGGSVLYRSEVRYNYDREMRVSRMQLVLVEDSDTRRLMRAETRLAYDDLGRLSRGDEFAFEYSASSGGAGTLVKVTGAAGLIVELAVGGLGGLEHRSVSWNGRYNISLTVSYNSDKGNPVTVSSLKMHHQDMPARNQDTKIKYYTGSALPSDVHGTDYIQYKYFPDGRLLTMQVNTGAPIEYKYDQLRGLLQRCGLVTYMYDQDGFLTQRLVGGQRQERLRYNAFGQLVEFEQQSGGQKLMVQYVYDAEQRLVLRRQLAGQDAVVTRLMYADPAWPGRLSHYMLDSASSRTLVSLHYDPLMGHLFALRVAGLDDAQTTTFAVLSDHMGSPRVILHSSGQAVWSCDYDVFGDPQPRLLWKGGPRIVVGYGGNFWDETAGLLLLEDRPYFPASRSFGSMDWRGLTRQLASLSTEPTAANSFLFRAPGSRFDWRELARPRFWLAGRGLRLHDNKAVVTANADSSVVKATAGLWTRFRWESVHSVLARHEEASFTQLHSPEPGRLSGRRLQLPPALIVPELATYSLLAPLAQTMRVSLRPDPTGLPQVWLWTLGSKDGSRVSAEASLLELLLRNTSLLLHSGAATKQSPMRVTLVKPDCRSLDNDLRQLGVQVTWSPQKQQQANVGISSGSSSSSQHRIGGLNITVSRLTGTGVRQILLQRQQDFILAVHYCTGPVTKELARLRAAAAVDTAAFFWVERRRQVFRNELMPQHQLFRERARRDELEKHNRLRTAILRPWFPVLQGKEGGDYDDDGTVHEDASGLKIIMPD